MANKKMRFSDLRKRIGTQAEVAKLLGISQQQISLYEKGKCKPSLKTAARFAKKLGISIDEIIECFD